MHWNDCATHQSAAECDCGNNADSIPAINKRYSEVASRIGPALFEQGISYNDFGEAVKTETIKLGAKPW
jgi:hypothetical protein